MKKKQKHCRIVILCTIFKFEADIQWYFVTDTDILLNLNTQSNRQLFRVEIKKKKEKRTFCNFY